MKRPIISTRPSLISIIAHSIRSQIAKVEYMKDPKNKAMESLLRDK